MCGNGAGRPTPDAAEGDRILHPIAKLIQTAKMAAAKAPAQTAVVKETSPTLRAEHYRLTSTTNIGGFFRASEKASSPEKGGSPEKASGGRSLAAVQPSGGNARSGGRSMAPQAGTVPAGAGQQAAGQQAAGRKDKAGIAAVARAAGRHRMEVDDLDLYGTKAGPPGRPVVSDLEAASCLLRWEPPRHTGGRDVPIIGHYITVQFAGDGGFFVHTLDTGSALPHAMLDGLRPDAWHEFQVSAITAEGRGASSQASRPALTPLAAALHRNLAKAKLQLTQTRAKLAEKREDLLRMGLADGAAPDPAQGLGRYGASASAPRMALLEAKGGRRQRAALEVSE